jgi:hypothetical protein
MPLDSFGFAIPDRIIDIIGLALLLFGAASSIKLLTLINNADRKQAISPLKFLLLSSLIGTILAAYILVYWK